ncbi:MAG: extracellular solute-binding protein [Alphaproteobacteria bacterium]|nr:extracellular solute-binding protein [Alphaproteobacteria bacterium]
MKAVPNYCANRHKHFWAAIICVAALFSGFPAFGADTGKRLFIITSFPETLFKRFTLAFEQIHPGVRVKVLNKKTSAAISYVQDQVAKRPDVFWASAPDAFEVLKESDDLEKFVFDAPGVAKAIGNYPINDPEGYYTGFAISGYGMMWNTRYMARHSLRSPHEWSDLTDPAYHKHLGITAPSRSGTTHLMVEGILQNRGWKDGWALLMEIGGNLATVTARSFSVVEGVNSGRFGIGLVIDFLGLSSKASGLPVDFAYSATTPFVPANVAVLKNAQNRELAETFVKFLLSGQGQNILFEPEIHRLPVVRGAYENAPVGFPNPFSANALVGDVTFDSRRSRLRYHLVNAMFDALVTFRVRKLNRVWGAIHRAEALLRGSFNADAAVAIAKARRLASEVPVSASQSMDPQFASIFIRKQRGRSVPDRQVELEKTWDEKVTQNLHEALHIAEAQAKALEAASGAGNPGAVR